MIGAPNTECSAVEYARLTRMIKVDHPWMKPIWTAVRDRNIGFGIAHHSAGAFDFPGVMPNLILFFDLAPGAAGPGSFHQASLRRFIRRCVGALVVSRVRDVDLYAGAAEATADLRKPVAIVETAAEREPLWIERLHKINPGLGVVVNGAGVGEAVH